jgi:hypothetical protein
MKYLVGILLLFMAMGTFAQQEKPLVQFSGVVYNADSTQVVIPYVTVTNSSAHNQVFVSNYKGYFSFVVHEKDTLVFTSIGFAPVKVVIPDHVYTKSYTMEVKIKPQAINLPTFRVFPWATTDEFRKDFLTMKLADDDLEIARKNIAHISVAALSNSIPRDAEEIQNAYAQNEHYDIVNSHSTVNPLLNPIGWGTLINQISQGDKSRASGN